MSVSSIAGGFQCKTSRVNEKPGHRKLCAQTPHPKTPTILPL